MGLARWMSWDAWTTDQLRRSNERTAQYQARWEQGQADLVTALLQGRQTLEGAVGYLSGLHPTQLQDGWYAGQHDLVRALRDGRVTLKAAALRLQVATADELEGILAHPSPQPPWRER